MPARMIVSWKKPYRKNTYSTFYIPGPVFTKGLRLSQVLDLNVVLKLRLLSQLSFVLNPYSQKAT